MNAFAAFTYANSCLHPFEENNQFNGIWSTYIYESVKLSGGADSECADRCLIDHEDKCHFYNYNVSIDTCYFGDFNDPGNTVITSLTDDGKSIQIGNGLYGNL